MLRRALLWMVPAILLCFGASLGHGLVWDDRWLIIGRFHPGSFTGWNAVWQPYWAGLGTTTTTAILYYRPMATLSFAVQGFLTGDAPLPLHLVNLVLHLTNATLLATLLRRAGSSVSVATGVAVLFLVHPVQVEPVVWVAGRTDLLALLFGLAALHVSFLPPRASHGVALGRALAVCALLACAVWSKEVGWAFLPLLCIGVPAPDGGRERGFTPSRRVYWGLLLATSLVVVATRAVALAGHGVPSSRAPWWVVPVRFWTSLGRMLEMVVWPYSPSALPMTRALPTATSPTLWLGVAASIGWLVALAVCFRRGRRGTGFGLLWAGLGLLPVLNIVPLSAPSPVAERFWYVPLAGLAWAGSSVLREMPRMGWTARRPARWAAIALGLSWAVTCFVRTPDWASNRTLWEAEFRAHGLRHPLTAWSLGLARRGDGDVGGALEVWSEALLREPRGDRTPWFETGAETARIRLDRGEPAAALALVERLLRLRPPEDLRRRLEDLAAEARAAGSATSPRRPPRS